MSKKPWYKSQTIQSALASFVVILTPVVQEAIQDGKIDEADTAIIIGGLATLISTIQGRFKATEEIGKEETETITPPVVASGPVNVPDFSQVGIPTLAQETTSQEPVEQSEDILDTVDSDEGDIDVFSLGAAEGKYYIIPNEDSKIKLIDKDSSLLDKSQFGEIKKGQKYYINSYKKESVNSISVSFEEDSDVSYFLFVPHITLYTSDNEVIDLSESAPELVNTKKTPIKLPGYSSTFYLEDSVIPNSHFSWGEFTKGGSRMPESKSVVENIIKIAKHLENLRSYLGNRPIKLTSAYRPPAVNKAVGGARKSRHLVGDAVDFYVVGMSIWEAQKKTIEFARKHNLAIGLGAKRGFIHLDARGYFVKWNY